MNKDPQRMDDSSAEEAAKPFESGDSAESYETAASRTVDASEQFAASREVDASDQAAVSRNADTSDGSIDANGDNVIRGFRREWVDTRNMVDGPQLRRERTPEEIQLKIQKKARRRKRARDIKKAALNKTPEKLKNPSDLQVRFRTGFVYIAVSVICIFAGQIPTMLWVMAMAGICAGEFFYMLRADAKLPNEALGIIAALLYPPSVYWFGLAGAMIVTMGLLLALIVWYVFFQRARVSDVGISFFGAAYTGLLLSGLIVIRKALPFPWGGLLVLTLFLSVEGNDVFAYLVGSRWGKHKLAPRTSPKKSWEGFIAGLCCSMVFWVIMSFIPGVTMNIFLAMFFGLITGLMSVLGDLAESRIKRNSGFKDSGTIMPGHGGLLDRCDSLFLASITAAILLVLGGCIPYDIF